MNVEIIALCDAATESGGKLNLLGAFDCIYAHEIPVIHAQCAISLRIRFSRIEEGEHRIKINVVDADGHAVMPSLDANIAVSIGPRDESVVTNLILNIHQLKLESWGKFSIDVAVDGRQEASLPLYLKKIPVEDGSELASEEGELGEDSEENESDPLG